MNQRRQELQSNLLADRLEGIFIAAKPYFKWVLIGVLALIVLAIGYGINVQSQSQREADAWSDLYFSANRQELLGDVYEQHPGSLGALWAKQTEADMLLDRALEMTFVDRNQSDELSEQASKSYEQILSKAKDSLLVTRATYSLAQSLETQGKSDDAVRNYKKLLSNKDIPERMREEVEQRISFIDSEEGKTFFTWFQSNRAAAPKSIDIPKNFNTLPDMPDIEFTVPKKTESVDAPANPDVPADSPKSDSTKELDSSIKIPPAPESKATEESESTKSLQLPDETSKDPAPPADTTSIELPATGSEKAPASGS